MMSNVASNQAVKTVPAIEAVDLTKVFGQRVSVSNLNLTVNSGELYALLGDNGAGKTTTINMLTTLLKPTSGRFFICGFDGVRQSEKAKAAFGIVSQDVSLYNELTAYENLSFVGNLYGLPRQLAERRIDELLARAHLSDRKHERAGSFSGGMQRKLGIACALLPEPKVLFMDEPTVGLDPASRRQIWQSLHELRNHGVTVFLTTHYLEEAEMLADRIGIIRSGNLVAEGTIAELRKKIQAIREIAIRLASPIEDEELSVKIARLKAVMPTEVRHDRLRATIYFGQGKNMELTESLNLILKWLQDENLPFTRFATSEPSLEEVFLAVTGDSKAGLKELVPDVETGYCGSASGSDAVHAAARLASADAVVESDEDAP